MYPFTKQLFEYNSSHQNDKIAMLILDVKGNYYKQVQKYANDYNLTNDLIVIGFDSNFYYIIKTKKVKFLFWWRESRINLII